VDLERGIATDAKAAFEFVTAPCPWQEEITLSGAVPVQAIQRIVEWLA
jgi:hypothetical protein